MGRSHFLKEKSVLEIEVNRNILSLKGKINSCCFSASQCIWYHAECTGIANLFAESSWPVLVGDPDKLKLSVAGVMKRWIRYCIWSSLYVKLQCGWDQVTGTVAGAWECKQHPKVGERGSRSWHTGRFPLPRTLLCQVPGFHTFSSSAVLVGNLLLKLWDIFCACQGKPLFFLKLSLFHPYTS